MILCETLLWMRFVKLQIYPVSLLSIPWLADMLSCCYSLWGMLSLPGINPVSKSLLPFVSLSWSFFWSLFSLWPLLARLASSSAAGLVFGKKIKELSGNPVIPLPVLLAKKFSCCATYCLVEVGDHGVQISNFVYQDQHLRLPAWWELQIYHL